MAGQRKSMGQLADEYFGDISMFKVQSKSPTENLEKTVETSVDESTAKEDVSSCPLETDTNRCTNLPEAYSSSTARKNINKEESDCSEQDKEEIQERSLNHDACFLSEDESEGAAGKSDEKKKKAKLNSPVPSEKEVNEVVNESQELGNSWLQDGSEGKGYQGERRRSSFGYFDGSIEDLSIMIFPDEAPARRKSSLGATIIIIPNEPKTQEAVADDKREGDVGAKWGNDGEEKDENNKGIDRCISGAIDKAVQAGEEGESVSDMLVEKDKNINQHNGGGSATRDIAVQVNDVNEGQDEIGENVNGAEGGGSGCIHIVEIQVGENEGADENGEQNELDNIPVEDGGDQDETCTLFEAWTRFAQFFGAMPYQIGRNDGESEIHTSLLCKVKWICNTVVSTIKTANIIPKTLAIFHGSGSPLSFLKLGGYFAQVLLYILFWRAIISKQNYLLQANNRLVSASYKHCKMSKLMTGLLIFTMVFVALANTLLYIAYQTKFEVADNFFSIRLNDTAKMLECRGQEVLTWNNNNCIPSEYMSSSNMFWSLVGMIVMANSIIIQTVIVLGIIIFCVTFFLATCDIRNRQMSCDNVGNDNNIVTRADYSDLAEFAEELSFFVGEFLMAYLFLHGLETPTLMKRLFSESIVVFISIIMNNGIIVFGLVMTSLATLMMKWIYDELKRQEGRQQRPVVSARLSAFVRKDIWSKKSGIGLPGLFIINFPIMFTYIGILGALYGTLWDDGSAK